MGHVYDVEGVGMRYAEEMRSRLHCIIVPLKGMGGDRC